uniref:Transmembrane protein 106 C-terminal domain-containing protein n=1 Tax=Neogobius melanostomus TaxID=47308 RepID=A0A8C6WTM9_9GOBI
TPETKSHKAVRLHIHGGLPVDFLPGSLLPISPERHSHSGVSAVVHGFLQHEKKNVDLKITNVFNISNGNFVPVQIKKLTLKGLIQQTIVGGITVTNASLVNSQSQKSYKIDTTLTIADPGLYSYCRTDFRIHTIFLELQLTLNISYLSHTEQLSLDTYEYIDCGTNSTAPHPISSDNLVK